MVGFLFSNVAYFMRNLGVRTKGVYERVVVGIVGEQDAAMEINVADNWEGGGR